jgi:hypothetical protein
MNGALLCGPAASCPDGYTCERKPGTNDNACYEIGKAPSGDMRMADLAPTDGLSKSTMCEELCNCLRTTCDGLGAASGADNDITACGTACLADDMQNLKCRWEHCTVFAVAGDAPLHCTHARGQVPAVCQ